MSAERWTAHRVRCDAEGCHARGPVSGDSEAHARTLAIGLNWSMSYASKRITDWCPDHGPGD